MPTRKPRVTFTISEEQLKAIENFQFENRIKNQTQAILSLLRIGLDDMSEKAESAPSTRDEALLDYFGQLDEHGQQMVIDYARLLVGSGEHSKNSADKLA